MSASRTMAPVACSLGSPNRYRVLIADDEPLARDRLRRLLAARPAYEVVAVCEDGVEAAAAIVSAAPDILLLDVRMPGLDGVALAATLHDLATVNPVLVFITAFDEYAPAAFEQGALDFLRKPIDDHKLDRALSRAESRLQSNTLQSGALELLQQLSRTHAALLRFAVRDGAGTYFITADDVDWIEAAGNYVGLHVGRHRHLVRDSINAVIAKLDPARFLRVHRSVIINVERIARVKAEAHGEYRIILRDGTRLTSSRAYNFQIRRLIG